MNSHLKSKWLEALRSEQFTQCWGGLIAGSEAEPTAHCCLGVLWHVAGKPQNINHLFYNTFTAEKTKETLIHMNDIEKKSFIEIADWVETHL